MKSSLSAKLALDQLHQRHPGLTEALSNTYCEAASVCLNRHHTSPVDMTIKSNGKSRTESLAFSVPDPRMLRAWANDIDATEAGAYGVSLAAVESEEKMVAMRRAETLTGADWYVAPIGASAEDMESFYRLEVSGINVGSWSAVRTRLKEKVAQTKKGASNLPAIAAVVGFEQKAIAIESVSDQK